MVLTHLYDLKIIVIVKKVDNRENMISWPDCGMVSVHRLILISREN